MRFKFLSIYLFIAVIVLSSCGKKKHELEEIVLDADTVLITVVDTTRVLVNNEPADTVELNFYNFTQNNLLGSIVENPPKNSVVIFLQGLKENHSYSLVSLHSEELPFVLDTIATNDAKIVVDKEELLDYELAKEWDFNLKEISLINQTEREFPVRILVKDQIDIPDLVINFNFNSQDLKDEVNGLVLKSMQIPVFETDFFGRKGVLLSGNNNDEALELENDLLKVKDNFSLIINAKHTYKNAGIEETILAGYDEDENEIIRLYFSGRELKTALNGVTISDLTYAFFPSDKNTVARTALVKSGNSYSLRVNNNGVKSSTFTETLNDVVHWSFGASKSQNSQITNELDGSIDNIRFYQRAISVQDYESILALDYE